MENIRKMYFLGIGGIGMSALARYFRNRGVEIHGYDRTATPLTRQLEQEGMSIHYEENLKLIPPGIDLVVYTPAVPATHRELVMFREMHFPIFKRAELLGWVSRNRRTIAVAGTHGKTTTSSIAAHLLRSAGIDCTAFLGGIALNFNSNFVDGKGAWMVAEADEYDRSFLQLQPEVAAILSMDADHLDIYGDPEAVMAQGYMAFSRQVKAGGALLVKSEWAGFFPDAGSFGVGVGDYRAEWKGIVEGHTLFDFFSPQGEVRNLRFPLPGKHNLENATAAMALALQTGLEAEALREGLAGFRGVKRRFERVVENKTVVYIDDYAHHPTELRAAIEAARAFYPGRRLTGIFQPHLYSRTRDFQDGFAEALDLLDVPVLLEIYPAREEPIPGVSSSMLLDKMKNPNRVLLQKDQVLGWIQENQTDVLLTLGAGDIDTLVDPIREILTARS